MPRKAATSIENNFSGGLKTEFTVLNFPENSCTDTDNCVFSLTGEVTRRLGIDHEENRVSANFDRSNMAINSYIWNNAGGDGTTRLYVLQVGHTLRFYKISAATVTSPLSAQILVSTVNINSFLPSGSSATVDTIECQFTDGNGYLFVFHPSLEPFYCTYNAGTITGSRIDLKIRDTVGIPEVGVEDSFRPPSLSAIHSYNLLNQGWTAATPWTTFSETTQTSGTGVQIFVVAAGLPVVIGQNVACVWDNGITPVITEVGVITAYAGTNLTVNVTSVNISGTLAGNPTYPWAIRPVDASYVNDWFTAIGNYPSNTDVWWRFKNSSGAFDPATTISQTSISSGPAPKGHFLLDAFTQLRTIASGIGNLTNVTTLARPKTGTWFAGRIWYAGVDANFTAIGTAPASSWTEILYFSQIIEKVEQFGRCYQQNDPTSEDLFDLLPSDGGTIVIQGSGSIFKLFPIQNGLLVFAQNGIWFITGSQGIGFTANDYTVTKISGVRCMSSTSFVDVLGYPLFWNEDGIYSISPGQTGSLTVTNIAQNSILSFYQDIPLQSKKFAKGSYNPLTYVVQWIFKSEDETNVTSRYEFDRVLNFNTAKQSFYPWTVSTSSLNHRIHDCKYVPGEPGTPSLFKYIESRFVSPGLYSFTFGEENNTGFRDWQKIDGVGVNYESSFTTGYKLHGNAIRKWQPMYLYMFSEAGEPTAYKLQGLWEFATSGNSGKWSSVQVINNGLTNFGTLVRRHRIRGHGIALQFKITSVENTPFNIQGWTVWETQNAAV